MTFDDFQIAAARTAICDDGGELTEDQRAGIAKEIGGVLNCCAALATDMGLNLGDIARESIALQERGTLMGDGDDR